MIYFKIIKDGSVVGAATSDELRRFQTKHRVVLTADIDHAQYIQYKDVLYHDGWMLPDNGGVASVVASVITIEKDEYDSIIAAIETGQTIVDESVNSEMTTEDADSSLVNPDEEITVEYVRAQKLKELNSICTGLIKAGFDIVLEDGNEHHFSLDYTDQINLITISSMLSAGENRIPYHADGELCRFYSANDISVILEKATQLKTFHTTYINALKAYINSLDTIQDISAIHYGDDVPDEFKSDVYYIITAGSGQ